MICELHNQTFPLSFTEKRNLSTSKTRYTPKQGILPQLIHNISFIHYMSYFLIYTAVGVD